MATLDAGGNAFDAAVAAAFVLQVVEPHFNGLGGEVSIVLNRAGDEQATSICGQGRMPRAASIERLTDLGLSQIPGSGFLPACVPGAWGAWLRLLRDFGTLSLEQVLTPAVEYCMDGFPLVAETAHALNTLGPFYAAEWPTSAATYLSNVGAPRAGDRFRNEQLGRTYLRLLREAQTRAGSREAKIDAAAAAFYQQFVAETVADFVREPVLDATGSRHAGLLTGDDFADWQPTVEPATCGRFGDLEVCKPGFWSQGPVFLQQLSLLECLDLSSVEFASADYIHLVVEGSKLAFADRDAWYGDPDLVDVPGAELLSNSYGAQRAALVGPAANWTTGAGEPGGRRPHMPNSPVAGTDTLLDVHLRQLENGLPTIVQLTVARDDTCCVTATDQTGNMVAATPSGGWLKSSPVVGTLGFALGTRGQTMSLDPAAANCLAPWKRPRTTLSPTVVRSEGLSRVAFGTPGGDRQDQWTLGFFLAHAQYGMSLQEATEVVAFHTDQVRSSFTPHEVFPGRLTVECAVRTDVLSELSDRGHEVNVVPALSLGRVCAVGLDELSGFVRAAASPRGPNPYAVAR